MVLIYVNDDRKIVVLSKEGTPKNTKGKTKTISYPKALIESNIGEKLDLNETIDHIDRNKRNDDFHNLIIKEKSFHSSQDARRLSISSVNCIWCKKHLYQVKIK